MEFNFNSYDNSKQSISYCEVDKCKAVVELKQQLDQLNAELRQYKSSKQASYEALQKECNELELANRKLKQANDEKNDLLQKLGISATGEFKRIKYYIDKLVAENEELKEEVKKQKEIAKEYEQRWLNSYGV